MKARALRLALLLIVSVAPGATAVGPTILGPGGLPCTKWADQRPEVFSAQGGWVLGYLSGLAVASNSRGLENSDDVWAIFQWIDNYCRVHPLDTVAVATHRLFDELNRRGPK